MLDELTQRRPMPKQPTARMKIINGRPYYYEVTNVWNAKEQRCHQKSKYLGKELPKGYRLIKWTNKGTFLSSRLCDKRKHLNNWIVISQKKKRRIPNVSERRLVPASRIHTTRDNIYSDPHTLWWSNDAHPWVTSGSTTASPCWSWKRSGRPHPCIWCHHAFLDLSQSFFPSPNASSDTNELKKASAALTVYLFSLCLEVAEH